MKQYRIGLVLLIAALGALPTSHANAQNQAEMNRQAAKDFEKADAELNNAYAALMAKVPDAESKQKLKQSQRAWLVFRDAEAAFAADQARGGSMAPTIRYETMTELTRERINHLKNRLRDDTTPDQEGTATPSPEEESAPPAAERKSYPQVPKEYEVGEDTVSPDGRFAILYPVRDEDSNEAPSLPNVLVRLQPYAVLKEIESDQGVTWKSGRGAPDAKWNGNSTVAIWHAMKWGNEDLVVYEIENDEVKRVQKIWPEVVKYFDRDWQTRFLKKYPKEGEGGDSYTFVSDRDDIKNFEFKGDKLLLDIFAENNPNLAPGPHWSAELRGVWDLKQAKFEKVDFKPGQISIRKPED